MARNARLLVAAFLALSAAPSFCAALELKGVPPRAITDPRSLTSIANPDAAPVAVADLFAVRGTADGVWAPDGKNIVVSTNFTGRYNLWEVPAEGGFPLQLTRSDDRQEGVAISPDGKTMIFESDFGGGEIYDLFAVPLAGGEPVNLTGTKDVSENAAKFLPDGKRILFSQRVATGATVDIGLMDLATRKATLLTHEATPGYFWSVAGLCDGGKVAIADRSNIFGTSASIWRIDIASGKSEALSDTAPSAYNSASAVSADCKTVALTTQDANGQKQAALLDTATHATKLVKPDVWEQASGSLTPDGRTMLFTGNVDGRTDLFSVTGGAVTRIDLPPGLNIEARDGDSLSPDGTKLLVTHEASNTPNDYWIVDLKTDAKKQITRLGLASVSPAVLPPSRIVHYKSKDGLVISALIWVPFNLKRDRSAPGVVFPHGGPTGQTTDYFSRTVQALATRGYVVIAPNVRGSTGYGNAFMEANKKDLGGADLTDEVYGAKFLEATGYVDPRKIGITGGSYGGYMTLMAIGKTPKLWAAAVEEYGIIDWFSMLEHEAPPLQAYEKGLLGDPVKDKAVYTAASPLTYIKNATAPLLVLQGDNDIRVPRQQAEMVVKTLKDEGRIVDAHFYAGEGHGFAKLENQIDSVQRMVAWFDKYLKSAR